MGTRQLKRMTQDLVSKAVKVAQPKSTSRTPAVKDHNHYMKCAVPGCLVRGYADAGSLSQHQLNLEHFPVLNASHNLPESAEHPVAKSPHWSKIPLGVGDDDREVFWDVLESAQGYIHGHTGSGKTIAAQNITHHVIQHSDRWDFVRIDLKDFRFSTYADFQSGNNPSYRVATDAASAAAILSDVDREMRQRYSLMEENKVNSYLDLDEPPKAVMVVIDEFHILLDPDNDPNSEMASRLYTLKDLGRSAGIHLILVSQTPPQRLGRISSPILRDISMVISMNSGFYGESGQPIRGRGKITINHMMNREVQTFQSYYLRENEVGAE